MEGAVGVEDAAADVALAVEDFEAAAAAINADADEDAAIDFAGRNGAIGVGVRGELVITLTAGREAERDKSYDDAAKGLGRKKPGNKTSILQREKLQT